MKTKNRIAAALLAAVLTLALTACGGSGVDKDPLAAAQANMAAAKSMDATMVMEMDMEAGGESMETVTTMNMTMFTDPQKMKVETSMDMGGYGSMDMSIYAEEVDGQLTMYLYDGSSWYSQAVTEADLGAYDVSGSMTDYIGDTTGFTQQGTETVDGVSAYKYTGVITGEEMQEVMTSSGALDSLSSLGLSADETEEMLSGLGDIQVTLWVAEKELYPVRYEMDMTAIMDGLMQSILASMGDQAEGLTMSVPKMKMTMTCSNLNSAADFEIPAEARS